MTDLFKIAHPRCDPNLNFGEGSLFAKVLAKEYRESEHPRDSKGRWSVGRAAAVVGGLAALAIAPGTTNLLRVQRLMDAGKIKPYGYEIRRWVRTGRLHRVEDAAVLSPYQEVARAITRNISPTARRRIALQTMGRDAIARRVMHLNHWAARPIAGKRPLDRGGTLFSRV